MKTIQYYLTISLLFGALLSNAQDSLQNGAVISNNKPLIFLNGSDLDDGAQIIRGSGDALRFKYKSSSIYFDALDDRAVVFMNSSSQTKIKLHPAGDSYFNGGNVGIGTGNPTGSLHIKKNIANAIGPELKLENNQYANSSGAGSSLKFFGFQEDRNVSIDGLMRGSGKSDRLEFNFEENGVFTNTMTMKYTGKVGIGTNAPTELLHLNDDDATVVLQVETGKVDGAARINMKNDAQSWDVRTASTDDFYIVDGNTVNVPFKIGPGTPTNTMYLKSSGNVGIGSSSAYNKLYVTETAVDKAAAVFAFQSTASPATGGQGIMLYNKDVTANALSAIKFDANDPGGNSRHMAQIVSGKEPGWVAGSSATYKGFLSFWTRPGGVEVERLRITSGGNVGIGTTSPDQKLAVKGKIHAEEVIVDLSVPGPDYVFADNYPLTTLQEVEDYIEQNKHLPEIPSAKEMEANGIALGTMNMLLLKKIEELTLYQIEQEKKIGQLRDQNEKLSREFLGRIEKLENKINN